MCLVGNGGMDYGDYYWALCSDYYRDPFLLGGSWVVISRVVSRIAV